MRRLLICTLLVASVLPPSSAGAGVLPPSAAGPIVYVPNVTKTLGGPTGWTTPVVIQNVGAAATTASVDVYRFSDGAFLAAITAPSMMPGQSFMFDPVAYTVLPHDTQFALRIRPAQGNVAATVLEGAGSSWMSYSGTATGTAYVTLPNITRRLGGPGGWDTPFIVQNLGDTATSVDVDYYDFATGALSASVHSTLIAAGRSHSFLPWLTAGLQDDRQYSVVITGGQGAKLNAVVNEHAGGQAMSYEGLLGGARSVGLPVVMKHVGGPGGWSAPFVVQNIGGDTRFSADFYSTTGALVATLPSVAVASGRSVPVDVRFTPQALPPGTYSVVVRGAPGAVLGAIVNQMELTAEMSMAYNGITTASSIAHVPYLEKSTGSTWSSTLIAQNLGRAQSTIAFTVFDGAGAIALRRTSLPIVPGATARLELATEGGLPAGRYSARVEAAEAVGAVANHIGSGAGDRAMSQTSAPEPCGTAADPSRTGIEGYVYAGIEPVANARIDAVTLQLEPVLVRTIHGSTTSGPDGHFRITGLPLGVDLWVETPEQADLILGGSGLWSVCANRTTDTSITNAVRAIRGLSVADGGSIAAGGSTITWDAVRGSSFYCVRIWNETNRQAVTADTCFGPGPNVGIGERATAPRFVTPPLISGAVHYISIIAYGPGTSGYEVNVGGLPSGGLRLTAR